MAPRPEPPEGLAEHDAVRRRRGIDMVEEERSLLGLDVVEIYDVKHDAHLDDHKDVLGADGRRSAWIVMILGAFQLFACYYASDVPSALHDQLEASFANGSSHALSFNTFFGLIYSVYSVPNIIIPLGGGMLVDRFGPAWMSLIFSSTLMAGQILVWIGVFARIENLVLLGRFVYGSGAESLCVSVSACLASWFHGSPHLALAMGISLSISRFGSVTTNVLSPMVARRAGVHMSFLVSIAVIGLCLPSAAYVLRLERRREELQASRAAAAAAASAGADAGAGTSPGTSTRPQLTIAHTWHSLRRWPASYWLLLVSCMAIYGTIMPFNNVASAFLIERICGGECCADGQISCAAHVSAESRASVLMGVPFAISAVGVPCLAFVVDRIGHRASFILCAAVTILFVHLLLALTALNAVVPLVLQGIGYTIFCTTLWPSITLVAPGDVGTAMGVVTAAQNLALAIVPLGVAGIHASSGTFRTAEYLFISLASVGIVSGTLLNIYDARVAHGLLNQARGSRAEPTLDKEDVAYCFGRKTESRDMLRQAKGRTPVQRCTMAETKGPEDAQSAGGRKDPRDEARAYLKKHNILGLFNELGSAVVFERPENVHEFLAAKLQDLAAKRKDGAQSSIFTDQDLETLFEMYDTGKSGTLGKDAFLSAVSALGTTPDKRKAPEGPLSKAEFVAYCKHELLIAGKDPCM
ncbi:Major facilitator superfamily domain-containing protein 1 [Hondaea fermentalgiana]|uniref:Lysosomal dipeptide transporter MFSD1 n=1 Tax=Hondaea fermentalgiana TaxID=2315210 RepID=A0A2R5GHK6_9STRA|nr:Major facilitator superfamily domain-containing protein 1 [Hondaea fermentalgiana]|eukprot:GBG30370.1 Major facilitator superfamily domain-containing protein 1 [Hondaea fermentalgiana]